METNKYNVNTKRTTEYADIITKNQTIYNIKRTYIKLPRTYKPHINNNDKPVINDRFWSTY